MKRLLAICVMSLTFYACAKSDGSSAADAAATTTTVAIANCVVGTHTIGNCKVN